MLDCLTDRGNLPADAAAFEHALACASDSPFGPLGTRFAAGKPIYVVRAPARLDCMGGIADYSGSLVCEMTLDRAVVMGIQSRDDRKVVVHSAGVDELGLSPDVTLALDDLAPGPGIVDYDTVKQLFSSTPESAWAAYVAGAFTVLQGEGHMDRFPHGATIVLGSNIPLRVGASSSAALEIATMHGLNLLYGINLDGMTLAVLSQKVENHVVGAACGIMDQVTCAMGTRGRLLSLLCQPHTMKEQIPIPDGLQFIGINSGIRREIKGARYTNSRIGAFMGLAILRDQLRSGNGVAAHLRPGYLCNLSTSEYVRSCRSLLPSTISGRAFMRRYGTTPDPVTAVDPEVVYKVRSRVEHPVYEHRRVTDFTEYIRLSGSSEKPALLERAGRLMYASDWSYTHRCGLGSTETAWIVREIRKLGMKSGFYGAKITGGGAGGTVAVAGNDRMFDHLGPLLERYGEATGIEAEVLTGTSPGALEFGHRIYRRT
ncbi:MAG: GHMP kinase [Gemmatimonadetes bacterium]|nr:GHMP kinase [Gemmatimonadota bacterium]